MRLERPGTGSLMTVHGGNMPVAMHGEYVRRFFRGWDLLSWSYSCPGDEQLKFYPEDC